MSEPNVEELLAADIEALCEKHQLESGLVAVARENHFLIVACNMTPKVMHILGHTLVQGTTSPPDVTLN